MNARTSNLTPCNRFDVVKRLSESILPVQGRICRYGGPRTIEIWSTTHNVVLKHTVALILQFLTYILALGSTHPLTEMSARNLPGGKGQLARKADNLTAICWLIF
jgi:hypothetical protein